MIIEVIVLQPIIYKSVFMAPAIIGTLSGYLIGKQHHDNQLKDKKD